MNSTPISILLLGTQASQLEESVRELKNFRVLRDAKDSASAALVVCALSDVKNFPIIESMDALSWIFVGELDSKGFQRLSSVAANKGLRSWRYLKTPLLEGELAAAAHAVVRENIATDADWRLRSHQALRSVLRIIGHEFANLLLRISSRADLAEREQNPEKLQNHLSKLAEATDVATELLKQVQEFSRQGFSPVPGSVSAVVESSFDGAKVEKLAKEPSVLIDATLFRSAMENTAEFLMKKMVSGAIAVRYEAVSEHGYPGLRVLITGTGEMKDEVSRDFRLPLAERIVELHGGILKMRSDSTKCELSVWLPISS